MPEIDGDLAEQPPDPIAASKAAGWLPHLLAVAKSAGLTAAAGAGLSMLRTTCKSGTPLICSS
jgi:hypothetical protein